MTNISKRSLIKPLPIVVLATLVQVIGCSTVSAASKTAIELYQSHPIGGPQRIVLSKSAVRIEQTNTGLVILSHDPYEEVTMLNPKKKCFVKKSLKAATKGMRGLSIVLFSTGEFSEQEWSAPKASKFQGFDSLVYSKKTPLKSWCQFTVLKEPKLSTNLNTLISAYSGGLPKEYGVPLKWEQLVTKGDRFNEFDKEKPVEVTAMFGTKSIKRISAPDSMFECPKDCRLTKENNEVMKSSVGYGSLKEMIKAPDFLFQSESRKIIDPVDKKHKDHKGQK